MVTDYGEGGPCRVTLDLGPNVELIDNVAGILGGVRLWDTDAGTLLCCYPAPGTETPESHSTNCSRVGTSPVLASTPSMIRPGISSRGM